MVYHIFFIDVLSSYDIVLKKIKLRLNTLNCLILSLVLTMVLFILDRKLWATRGTYCAEIAKCKISC